MKKFLKSLVAVALATTTLADFDLEFAANGGVYASRSSTIAWTQIVGDTAAATTSTAWSASGFVQNWGADVRGLYCVTDGLYLGLSVGVGQEFAFPAIVMESKLAETAEEKTTVVANQTGTAYYLIPIKAVVKYDFNDVLLAESNMYLTARAGINYAINANANALKTGDRYIAVDSIYAKTATTTAAVPHTINLLSNLAFDAGLGFEYMGAQLEVYFAYKSVGTTVAPGEVAINSATASTESETKASSAYVNYSGNVSLGYRLKDLF